MPVAPVVAAPAPARAAAVAGSSRSLSVRALNATSRPTSAPPAAQTTSAVRQSVSVMRNTMVTGATALPSIPAAVWNENARPMRRGSTEALSSE